jgi:predicted HNH restriction endonuclease
MKRTPMTKTKTKRLSAYDRDFEKMKPVVRERAKDYCEAMGFVLDKLHAENGSELAKAFINDRNCMSIGTHVHHRKYRSRGGTNSLDNLLNVCPACHEWIHSNPMLSNALGLSLHAGESEELE